MTLLENVTTVLKGSTEETLTANEARNVVLAASAASAIGAGMYTRSRATDGKPPIMKFLF